MARVWIARHLPHASGHGHPMGSQKKKYKKKKEEKLWKTVVRGRWGELLFIIALTGDSTSSTC